MKKLFDLRLSIILGIFLILSCTTQTDDKTEVDKERTYDLRILGGRHEWVSDINDNLKVVFEILNNDSAPFEGYVCVYARNYNVSPKVRSVYPIMAGVRGGTPQYPLEGERLFITKSKPQWIEAWIPIPPGRPRFNEFTIYIYSKDGKMIKSRHFDI